MNFFYRLQDWFVYLTQVFVDAALFCYDFGWPLEGLGDFFNWLSDGTARIAGYMWDGAQWWNEIENAVRDILSWDTIRDLIRSWLYRIEEMLAWWYYWWEEVTGVIDVWWLATQETVKGWIEVATEGFEELVEAWDTFWKITWPEWTGKLTELRALWDNFWTTILPTLVNFDWLATWWDSRLVEINSLIDSAIRTWFPFYDDLVSLWGEIKAFFVDPLQWTYDKLDEWFERFW